MNGVITPIREVVDEDLISDFKRSDKHRLNQLEQRKLPVRDSDKTVESRSIASNKLYS